MNDSRKIEDLRHIRNLMERSSKFLSLSGLSSIAAGIVALIGAAVAYFILFKQGTVKYDEHMRALGDSSTIAIRLQMAILVTVILICAVSAGWYFSSRKARKSGVSLWTTTSKRTLYHFLLPLLTGGLFCIALAVNNNIHLIASAMLIFYGLALINAGKFTVDEVHYLGISEILLGLLSGFFLNYGLLFWVIGFGVMHIIYGIRMYYKYDRK